MHAAHGEHCRRSSRLASLPQALVPGSTRSAPICSSPLRATWGGWEGRNCGKDENSHPRRQSLPIPIIWTPALETNPRPRLQIRRATHKDVRRVPTEPRIGESEHPGCIGLAGSLRRGGPFSFVRFFDSRHALASSGPASPFGRASRTSWANKRNEPAAQRTNAVGFDQTRERTNVRTPKAWIPAFAGMTSKNNSRGCRDAHGFR